MRTLHSVLFASVLTAIGCTGSAQVHTEGDVAYTQPALVEVEPGVQVVADYDEPVFYSDNMYWRYEGGVWYQSRYHNRAWARVDAPPVAVRHIERPEMYVHYHGRADVGGGPVIRDHRTNENAIVAPAPTPAPQPAPQPQPQPDVRDHRDDATVRADVHANVHGDVRAEERRDERQERKDDREVSHDKGELKHDQGELNAEIKRDEARGNETEDARDRKELARDQKETAKDKRELKKDEKRRDKDERKEMHDKH